MQYETRLDQKSTTLTLSIKRVLHLEYTKEIYRTEFPYSKNAIAGIGIFSKKNGKETSPHSSVVRALDLETRGCGFDCRAGQPNRGPV